MTQIIYLTPEQTQAYLQAQFDYINAHKEIEDSVQACDFHERNWCSKQQAQWIALAAHECGAWRHYLICSPCKEFFLHCEESFECRGCGDIVTPVRHLFSRIEPI